MYNVVWLQGKRPGSQYPLPQMSVFASRDIKQGEVLYAFYNTAYCMFLLLVRGLHIRRSLCVVGQDNYAWYAVVQH